MENLRLFLAVTIDSQPLVAKLTQFQEQFDFQGIKLVEPNLFHFSIYFLGDTSTDLVSDLEEIISSINVAPFTAIIKGSGVFRNLQNITVIWAGLTTGTDELNSIKNQMLDPLEKIGFQLNTRSSSHHLTLARVKFLKPDVKKQVQSIITANTEKDFGSQEITQVHLMQSTLTPTGPIYRSLFHKDLT